MEKQQNADECQQLKHDKRKKEQHILYLEEEGAKKDEILAKRENQIKKLQKESTKKDAEIKQLKQELEEKDAEIKRQAEEIKLQAEEIKLLKLDRAEKEKKIKQLESDLNDLREIVNGIAVSHNVHQKLVEEYEIKLAGLSDHRNWQKSEAEQILAHHLCDAEMEVKQLDYELTEHKKKRDAQMETREFADTITQHNDLEELGETGSQTDIKQFTDIGTQTNGQFIGHWRLLIGLFIIVLFVCGLLYNQFGPFRIAIMLHYIRGPPPF
ncbi:hypothetical protein niasHT_001305 [Heterodera trifolii]|uniref:Uncharacterized protein n=1 Tax=Heterodera trifolii TaxID=157864 RepID=A0ABD2M7S1_9BILA